MKYNIILHTTTSCNFNCSYCNVIKDNKKLSNLDIKKIIDFIKNNSSYINGFKFFGGEPLLVWKDIKYIIDNSNKYIGDKYEIITNTSILNEEIGNYFDKYFETISFSIDSENNFDYDLVFSFIKKHNLTNKIVFNLIISPGKEEFGYNQFIKIYESGFKKYNILPVYFTKIREKENLINLSNVLKKIVDKSLTDNYLHLYGFNSNSGYNSSLVNSNLFINIDLKLYYSDFVSLGLGKVAEKELLIGDLLKDDKLKDLNINGKKEILYTYETNLIKKISGQLELHKIMDYFSLYINYKKGIKKD